MSAERAHLHAVPPPVAGRVPPNDLDAEAAVLSAVLLTGGLDRVADRLKPEDFYADANARIYAAALELWREGRPVDLVTVAGALRDCDRLRAVGGPAYLTQLADATPAVAHLEAHADRVAEKARVRRMIAACQLLAAEGYGDIGPTQAWLDGAEHTVCEVSRLADSSSLVHAREAIKAMFTRVMAAAESGNKITGTPTGLTYLDAKLGGLQAGQLVVVAARPGMGKSSFALNVALNVAAAGHGVAFFSLEMTRDELAMRAACSEAGIHVSRLREGEVRECEWPRLTEAARAVSSWPLLWDDTASLSPLDLRARARRAASEFTRSGRALKLIVVDYVQLMNASALMRKSDNREREVSIISQSLKRLAKEQGVTVLALAQLNRLVEYRGAKDKRPRLADIRESGSLEQDADAVLFVHREGYYDRNTDDTVAELIVAKQRNGPQCIVKAKWYGATCRFDNLDPTPGQEAAS
jgi:replicative DNA helicase